MIVVLRVIFEYNEKDHVLFVRLDGLGKILLERGLLVIKQFRSNEERLARSKLRLARVLKGNKPLLTAMAMTMTTMMKTRNSVL